MKIYTTAGNTCRASGTAQPSLVDTYQYELDRRAVGWVVDNEDSHAGSVIHHALPVPDILGDSIGVWFTATESDPVADFRAAGPIFLTERPNVSAR